MKINWYPGHMKKTKELLIKNLKLIDIVYEVVDARIPYSSKNPDIDTIIHDKPQITILNKFDLSSNNGNKIWNDYYKNNDKSFVFVNAQKKQGTEKILQISNNVIREKRKTLNKKGIKNKAIRAIIVGIPNVGKSTIINALTKTKSAKTGNKPGVTKGKQWIKLRKNIQLLDTPGILWPNLNDKKVGMNLAFTGAIKEDVFDNELLALKLIDKLISLAPKLLEARYKIKIKGKESIEVMNDIAKKRGCIVKGGEVDYSRVSSIILNEFRNGKIGRVTLEFPPKHE